MAKVAVVQVAPVLLDREATVASLSERCAEAAEAGAELIVCPEAAIPGYPTWIWRLRPGGDMKLSATLHKRLVASAVSLEAGHLDPLAAIAKAHGVELLVGVTERDGDGSRATLYNTYVHLGSDGAVANRHRKLMPTNPERMVWGFGDASGLRVVDTPLGRVGALVCWENFMPLARMALYGQGVEIYVAPTWDSGDGWIGTLQHIAREGRCYVIGSCSALTGADIPSSFPDKERLFGDPEEWINPGDSVVVAPGGGIVAGPLRREQGILYADVDVSDVATARRSLDVAGHYSRPDVFELTVHRGEQRAVRFTER